LLKRKIFLLFIFSFLILSGCGNLLDWLGFDHRSGGAPSGERMWTVMVYIASDNNMGNIAVYNINQMESVGSSSNLAILVQWDTGKGCKRYYIQRDSDPKVINSPVIQSMPDQNTGDPDVLANFIKWAVANYPAKHYCLILWNHGSGWKPLVRRIQPRAICIDDSSNDALDTEELREALEKAGVKIDLLGMDACLMQMVEVATEVKDWVGYVCASQEDEPWDGWAYDAFLASLQANPTMDASQLGKAIVDAYINYYYKQDPHSQVTLSLVSTSSLTDFASSISSLGDKLASLYPSSSIDSAIQSAQQFSDDDYKDIFHFAQLVRDNVEEAKIEAETVFNLKNKVVLYRGELNIQNAQGLSIYLTKSGFANYQASYSSLLFGQIATGWINFLKKLNGL
jgi:hypothetical protein